MPVDIKQLEKHEAVSRHQWPQALILQAEDCLADLSLSILDRRALADGEKPMAIARQLETLAAEHDGIFMKVCGFSWKGTRIFELTDGKIADRLDVDLYFSDVPLRISRLLSSAPPDRYPGRIEIYKWRAIDPASEFRVFMQNRRVVGVSQYHDSEQFAEIYSNLVEIHVALSRFGVWLQNNCHVDDVAADVVTEGAVNNWNVRLIELNPLHHGTGRCLFPLPRFDGMLRFRGEAGKVMGVPLNV